jgi:hypothetical protein
MTVTLTRRVGGFPAHAVIRVGEIIEHEIGNVTYHRVGGRPAR